MQSPWIPRGDKRKVSRAAHLSPKRTASPQDISRGRTISKGAALKKTVVGRDKATTTGRGQGGDATLQEFSREPRRTEDVVKVCQQCGSTSIHPYSLMMGFEMDSSLREYCMSCSHGYNGQVIFPAIPESELKEFRRRLKEEVLVPW